MSRIFQIRRSMGRLIALITLLGTVRWVDAQEPYFPESVFLPKNKEVNSSIDDVTAVHLRAMLEPSLWKLSQRDSDITVYRMLWLASNEHPICIRLNRAGGAYTLHVARHDGPPGMTAGRQDLDKDVKLNAQQGEMLIARLERTPFWLVPVEVKESRGIADGDVIVIEGLKAGRYHVVRRAGSATGESVKAFCRSLLELAGEPESLQAWDRFRDEERASPRYRAEPPQTEDLGEQEADPFGVPGD